MDEYTGDVTNDGPSQTRDLGSLMLRKCSVGRMHNNAYLLTCTATGAQILVDAATDPDRLEALVAEGTGRLDGIVTTHRHWDHVGALEEMARRTGAPTLAGRNDADDIPVPPDTRLAQGDTVTVGDVSLDVIELRGHTPGAIALAWQDDTGRHHLISGDSLFPGGPGKTDTPEAFTSLMDDLEARVFGEYGDDTWVYPGHGSDTTLGTERPRLGEWRARGW